MAKGYPDFFGQSIFLRYGGTQEVGGGVVAAAGATTIITQIAGKGVMYLCELFVNDVDVNILDRLHCQINDQEIASPTWNTLLIFGRFVFSLGAWVLGSYNPTDYLFFASLSGPMTFDTNVIVSYENVGPNPVTCSAYIEYALYS